MVDKKPTWKRDERYHPTKDLDAAQARQLGRQMAKKIWEESGISEFIDAAFAENCRRCSDQMKKELTQKILAAFVEAKEQPPAVLIRILRQYSPIPMDLNHE